MNNGNNTGTALSEARDQFVSQWGVIGSAWGVNRTMAQIHALLITAPAALSTDDIMEELGPLVSEVRAAPDLPPVRHPTELALSDSERSLLGHLDDQPTGVDDLITRTGMTAGQVMATLSVLELKRLVRRLPGHRFVRV